MPLLQQRAIHVGFAIILSLFAIRAFKGNEEKNKLTILDIFLSGFVIVSVSNVFLHSYDYLTYMGDFSTFELIIGAITIIVVLESARRTQGLVFICTFH